MNPREEALLRICEQYSVDILYAHGSRARETKDWLGRKIAELAPGPSDLDVGVKPSAGKRLSAREKAQADRRNALAAESCLRLPD